MDYGALKRQIPSAMVAFIATIFFCIGILLLLSKLSGFLPIVLMALIILSLLIMVLASVMLGRQWGNASARILGIYSITLLILTFLIGLNRLMVYIEPLLG